MSAPTPRMKKVWHACNNLAALIYSIWARRLKQLLRLLATTSLVDAERVRVLLQPGQEPASSINEPRPPPTNTPRNEDYLLFAQTGSREGCGKTTRGAGRYGNNRPSFTLKYTPEMPEAAGTQMQRTAVHEQDFTLKFTPCWTNLSSMASPISPQEPSSAGDAGEGKQRCPSDEQPREHQQSQKDESGSRRRARACEDNALVSERASERAGGRSARTGTTPLLKGLT